MFLDASTDNVGGGIVLVLVFAVVAAAYFLPTLIAWGRHHRTGSVFVVNLLVGWSLVGWIISLVMAVGQKEQHVVITHVNASAELPKA